MERLSVRKPGFRIGASFRVAFSDDGLHLATVGKRVSVWSVPERRRVGAAHPFSHECEVDISPDGRSVVVKNTRGDVVVLDRETLGERLRLSGKPYGEGTAIRFSPCGRFVIDGSWAGDLLVRDAETGEVLLHEQGGSVRALHCSRDRTRWAYSTRETGFVGRIWPFDENEPAPLLVSPTPLGLEWGAISDDGMLLARATFQVVESWKLASREGEPELVGRCEVPISGTGYAVAWHPTGRYFAYAGRDVALILTADARPLWWGPGFQYASDAAFSPDGNLLAVGDWSKGAVLAMSQLDLIT